MKAVCTLFFVLLSVGVAAPAAASPAVPTPALPDMTSVWLNAAVAAPVAAWPWDSEQPGSFLVFPYFRTGTVMTTDQGKLPRTEFEISVLCPSGETCLDHQKVYLHAEWVCGSDDESFPDLCDGRDFFIETTVNATVYFSPQPATDMVNLGPNATVISALPPCNEGELLVWVVDDKTDANPIKFDGLIGDEVTHSNEGSSGKAPAGEYNAIAIQASENLSTGDALPQLDATTHAELR